MTAPEPDGTARQAAELEARYAALQQAARSRGADPGGMLDAAFTELEAAIDLLREAGTGPGAGQPGDRDGMGAATAPSAVCSGRRSRTRPSRCS